MPCVKIPDASILLATAQIVFWPALQERISICRFGYERRSHSWLCNGSRSIIDARIFRSACVAFGEDFFFFLYRIYSTVSVLFFFFFCFLVIQYSVHDQARFDSSELEFCRFYLPYFLILVMINVLKNHGNTHISGKSVDHNFTVNGKHV